LRTKTDGEDIISCVVDSAKESGAFEDTVKWRWALLCAKRVEDNWFYRQQQIELNFIETDNTCTDFL